MKNSATSDHRNGLEVAVIGTAYRFPGANNAYEFWQNLKNGVESISFFSDPELEASVTDPAVLNDPRYVKAGAIVEGVELFDADFFGYSPREAELIDPQHRLFLECAWEALEGAGYDSETYTGLIGVYAGASLNTYLLSLFADDDLKNSLDPLQAVLANDKDFLTTRVSYKLNLEGPSVTVQSACSTALVAIHLAYQSLLSGDCDMALAGAASIRLPQKAGYFSAKGGILSPDGHCRVFDAKARGTVRGNGVGIVVLKRLTDALADGDSIYAVIKGSAINNDGGSKIGFTAPRADGQAKVIQAAHLVAGIEPETIGYVEAHGTGTELGDPIEVEALTKAFRTDSERKNFCAIGSVKSNIGHLDATAGVAGFIKTVLTLKHRLIPPSLNFEEPNPRIDFKNSPFYVNTRPREWEAAPAVPRRAGVSSFGMGGTNAHVVLEEAPEVEASGESRPWQLLMLSARTERGLEEATKALAMQLRRDKGANLADVAYTLAVGRRAFSHRRVLVCSDTEDAITSLEKLDPERVFTAYGELRPRQVALMFSGQGAQYTNMARDLYQSEPVFREQIDHCSELLKPDLGLDLRAVLYPTEEQTPTADSHLAQTSVT